MRLKCEIEMSVLEIIYNNLSWRDADLSLHSSNTNVDLIVEGLDSLKECFSKL